MSWTRCFSDLELVTEALALDASRREPLARRLEELGGLFGVYRSGAATLEGVIDAPELRRLEILFAMTTRLVAPPALPSIIEDAEDVAAYFRPRLLSSLVESFWVLMLDVRGRPMGAVRVAEGTLTACLVHPREVFAPALRARAASIVAVHNHPSGDSSPSAEDRALTERLASAGELLGIPLVDHVVVARSGYASLGGSASAPMRAPARDARASHR